jgi:hypothetical protein
VTHPHAFDDAGYVLGALDDAERRAFEDHLAGCPDCRARVREARAAVDLLGAVTAADLADAGPVPDTLLPALLRAARRSRTRRHWLTGTLGAIAAACVIALAVVLWPGSGSGAPPTRSFAAVRPTPITATAKLVARSWGTEIDLRCRYAGQVASYQPYELVVTDTAGTRYHAGSWTLTPGQVTAFTGGAAVPREQIKTVQITTADGTPILQLTR